MVHVNAKNYTFLKEIENICKRSSPALAKQFAGSRVQMELKITIITETKNRDEIYLKSHCNRLRPTCRMSFTLKITKLRSQENDACLFQKREQYFTFFSAGLEQGTSRFG
jgi:hypothetical protein